jgi:hypothetical protein
MEKLSSLFYISPGIETDFKICANPLPNPYHLRETFLYLLQDIHCLQANRTRMKNKKLITDMKFDLEEVRCL